VIHKLEAALASAHRKARIVGAVSPPFGPLFNEQAVRAVESIRDAQPDVVWCGLGAPKQELWMARSSKALAVPMMIGVGAGIDYLAEAKPAAPTVLRHAGLEWAFRLAAEPRRLWQRYLFGNASFIWMLARERFGSGSGTGTGSAEADSETKQ